MSTNSSITVKREDGKYVSAYCHWDGYVSHNGKLLRENYTTYNKALALVSLGNMSVLAPSIDCPEGHTFGFPVDNCTVYYGRDRGEDNEGPLIVNDMIFVRHENWQSYNYLFEDGQWWIATKDGQRVEFTI